MDRLQAFETMLSDLQAKAAQEKKAMDDLKARGREKTAAYRQYMGNRLMITRMLELYRQYGLIQGKE